MPFNIRNNVNGIFKQLFSEHKNEIYTKQKLITTFLVQILLRLIVSLINKLKMGKRQSFLDLEKVYWCSLARTVYFTEIASINCIGVQ